VVATLAVVVVTVDVAVVFGVLDEPVCADAVVVFVFKLAFG
jgi:hypothetical protein